MRGGGLKIQDSRRWKQKRSAPWQRYIKLSPPWLLVYNFQRIPNLKELYIAFRNSSELTTANPQKLGQYAAQHFSTIDVLRFLEYQKR